MPNGLPCGSSTIAIRPCGPTSIGGARAPPPPPAAPGGGGGGRSGGGGGKVRRPGGGVGGDLRRPAPGGGASPLGAHRIPAVLGFTAGVRPAEDRRVEGAGSVEVRGAEVDPARRAGRP